MRPCSARSVLVAAAVAVSLAGAEVRAAGPTTADCLAATESSIQLGNEHKLRAERQELLVCAAASCPADIRKDCSGRVDRINGEIPTIIFRAKDASGADLSAVKVSMDGETLADRLEGTALAVDPGEHAFTFEVEGQPPVTRRFLIQQSQKDRAELVTLGEAAPPPAAAPGQAAAATSSGLGAQKIVSLIVGGVGVVGLGVGAAAGLVALSQKSTAQSACPGAECSTPAGSKDWSTAASTGNVSTIAWIVGAVGLAGAGVLWFTAPGGRGAQVGLGPASVELRGTW